MGEDPTQITLRTVLEAINSLGIELHNFRVEVEKKFAEVEKRFERLEATMSERLDSVEGSINVLSGDVTRLRSRSFKIARPSDEPEGKRA